MLKEVHWQVADRRRKVVSRSNETENPRMAATYDSEICVGSGDRVDGKGGVTRGLQHQQSHAAFMTRAEKSLGKTSDGSPVSPSFSIVPGLWMLRGWRWSLETNGPRCRSCSFATGNLRTCCFLFHIQIVPLPTEEGSSNEHKAFLQLIALSFITICYDEARRRTKSSNHHRKTCPRLIRELCPRWRCSLVASAKLAEIISLDAFLVPWLNHPWIRWQSNQRSTDHASMAIMFVSLR